MTRALLAVVIFITLSAWAPKPVQPHIRSIGIITALGDTCMFERVPDHPFEWIAPPEASFLEISDWGIDDAVTADITKLLGAHYRVQPIAVEHQDFDTWTYDSLARDIRELPIPETPVDAYLLVLRDWRHDGIGKTDHQIAGLGLYRRDLRGSAERLGAFASYRLALLDPNTGKVIASRAALLPSGRLPWLPAEPALWPPTQNDLTDAQRRELRTDLLKLIDNSLPHTLRLLGLRD
ncbi:MAG TPA: hypothetical protein VHX61_08250 [Rhizomicrobium sp.]|jgi:hypothetical protein|nr:hypothetical protein [Rhizomicrobium sp.]